ncbi:BZ3500_MvSof-1268-A1-R1_Chr2-1g04593 [Microbotryum saponariae]|uniref:BZ3500_MvSof-1268-A1-R1_Chr2-1g04593 protein n=1 Tax=Microbotryum saponariae TaxID=289078 RepID=A0A2X0K6X4_9BASI|nr:BZ3500_MvSof-1268-A1-R1_Chr2-1g04593 [Microbotryum saponariae]SCZ92113.1 BZ3501_MvSof-1269-A2-R1_Chr2-1g04249 [Microbotryum saponariae]
MSQLARRTPSSVRASRLARASQVQLEAEEERLPVLQERQEAHSQPQESDPDLPHDDGDDDDDHDEQVPALPALPPEDPDEAPSSPASRPAENLSLPRQALQHLDHQAGQALALNRAYQKKLVARMSKLAERDEQLNRFKLLLDSIVYDENQEAPPQSEDEEEGDDHDPQAHPQVLPAAQVNIVANGFKEVALPWFKHFHGQSLPPNRDAKIKEAYLTLTKFHAWSASDRLRLKQEVATQLSRRQHLQDQDQESVLDSCPRGNPFTDHRDGLEQSSSAPIEPLDPEWMADSIDWDAIALVVSQNRLAHPSCENLTAFPSPHQFPRHTSIDCRLQYLQHDHPRINVEPWTSTELERLYSLHETLPQPTNLSTLSTELGTHRTPSDCLRQLRRRPYHSLPRPFDASEDAKLLQGMTLYGQDWQALSAYVGRPANALITRWTKTLQPDIKKGKFTPEEDELLLQAVERWGTKKWKEVSSVVRFRTDAQCRERWFNHLDPEVRQNKKKRWTQQEDELLRRLRAEGMGWSLLAKRFKGRTDNACLVRMRTIEAQAKRAKAKAEKEAADQSASKKGTKKRAQEGEGGRAGKKKKKTQVEVEVEVEVVESEEQESE